MARRVTPVEIEEMNRLYVLYGTYAEVGRMMKRSGSTVARYVSRKQTDRFILKSVTEVIEV